MCAAALLSTVASAQPLADPADYDGRTVTAIELHLPAGVPEAGLAERVLVRRGQKLSLRAVRDSIERLWATDRFADVVVRAGAHDGGVRLVFELSARRCIEGLSAERSRRDRQLPLEVRGELLSDEEVLRASGLSARGKDAGECPEAAEYYPERLKQAVDGIRAAYRARGFHEADAAVELFEQTGGMVVNFVVTAGEPTRVGGVSIAGDPGFSLPRLLTESGLQTGAILNRTLLDGATRRLREALRREQYWRARVGEPVVRREGRVAHVSLPVSAGPRFSIRFQGNRSFTDRQLAAVLGYDGADTLDQSVLARLEGRLRGFYRDSGFFDAQVTVAEHVRPDGAEAVLAFAIEEAAPLFVRELVFEGNTAISDAELREIAIGHVRGRTPVLAGEVPVLDDPLDLEGRTRSERVASPLLGPANIYSEDAYRSAADAMTALYRDRGFLDAVVALSSASLRTDGAPPPAPVSGSGSGGGSEVRPLAYGEARVAFSVQEGPQTIVREFTVHGGPSEFKGQALVARYLQTGAALNYGRVEQAATELTRALNADGYLFAAVSHVVSTGGEGTELNGAVEYRLDTGPQVRVGDIRVLSTDEAGAVRAMSSAEEALVRAHLVIREGEVLVPSALFDSQRELVLTGAFRQVAVRIVDPDAAASIKDVEVVVRRSARYSGEVGGGIALSEGPRVVVDARAPNFNGSGINLSARGKLNYVGASAPFLFGCVSETALCIPPDAITGFAGLGGRGNLSLHQPRIIALLPLQVGLRADAVAERIHRPVYAFTRFAGITGLDWSHGFDFAFARVFGDRGVVMSANVQYELEHDRVAVLFADADANQSAVRLSERFPVGNYTLHNALARLSIDMRDDATNPTRGAVMSVSSELTHGLLATITVEDPEGGDREEPLNLRMLTLKTRANLNAYLPVPLTKFVLAFSAQAGQIFKLSPDSHPDDPVLPKRFFLGGFNTMRGFREDAMVPQERRMELRQELSQCDAILHGAGCTSEAQAVRGGREPISEGGQQFALAKLELRFPVVSAINLGLFFEAGNLWRDPQSPLSLTWESLRYVAGAGLRYGTPIGPLAFDFGFNLAPDIRLNEPLFTFHFSIGLF